jgi:Cu-Zn family superoxide dismutase
MDRTTRMTCFAIIGSAALLAACQKNDDAAVNIDEPANIAIENGSADGLPNTQSASVALNGGDGASMGSLTATEDAAGVTLKLTVAGMPAGVHGVHLHTTGLCEEPKFESAGSHWNPTGKQHGRDNPAGAHSGDLDNLTVAADGSGNATFTIAGATLGPGPMSLADDDGTALVVHAKADDYKTDPSGASGDRIACAVIAPSKAPQAA